MRVRERRSRRKREKVNRKMNEKERGEDRDGKG